MKKLICILASAALFGACEQKTTTVNPPADKKTETNTTIVNPPAEKKTDDAPLSMQSIQSSDAKAEAAASPNP